jgi:hypothetical protein
VIASECDLLLASIDSRASIVAHLGHALESAGAPLNRSRNADAVRAVRALEFSRLAVECAEYLAAEETR